MNTSKATELIRFGRVYAARQMPWFANALFSARLVITESCPSLAAIDDDMRVYFNPALCNRIIDSSDRESAVKQFAFLWIHEINHVLRDHSSRARELKALPKRWNIAADLEINDTDWNGLKPPVLFPPLLPRLFGQPNGKLAEVYYHALSSRQETPESRADDEALSDSLDEGSGVDGQPRAWEVKSDPSDEDFSGITSVEQKLLRKQVAEAIQREKHRGVVPESLLRWSDSMLQPQVDWRRHLRRFIQRVLTTGGTRQDYSYHRPHRRSAQFAPLIRPRLESWTPPHIACVVDTSGSMSRSDLEAALSEVWGVLSAVNGPITLIPCDSIAKDPIRLVTKTDITRLCKQLKGGGGTDMREGINAALQLKQTPSVIIVLTDGHTPYHHARLSVPVMFAIFASKIRRSPPRLPPMPPWSPQDVIEIKPGDI